MKKVLIFSILLMFVISACSSKQIAENGIISNGEIITIGIDSTPMDTIISESTNVENNVVKNEPQKLEYTEDEYNVIDSPMMLVDENLNNRFYEDLLNNIGERPESFEILDTDASNISTIENTYDFIAAINKAKCVTEYPDTATVNDFDSVKFGKYEQDGNEFNGKEDIEWIVLNKEGNKFLLLSKYVLNCINYDDDVRNLDANHDITWEISGIRKYLNDNFIKETFSEEEREKILLTNVINEDNHERDQYNPGHNFNTEGGEDTNDKIFCLSLNECKKYFAIKDINECNKKLATKATEYAKEKLGELHYSTDNDWTRDYCSFWLRNPGCNECHAMFTAYDGYIDTSGEFDGSGVVGIRPAMWIEMKY